MNLCIFPAIGEQNWPTPLRIAQNAPNDSPLQHLLPSRPSDTLLWPETDGYIYRGEDPRGKVAHTVILQELSSRQLDLYEKHETLAIFKKDLDTLTPILGMKTTVNIENTC